MTVRMRKVLAIPQSCVVWPLLSDGLLIFCVSLFLLALYFSLRTTYFSAYSLCKRFIQNFHPLPLTTPSKKSLKSISIWVSSDKFGCNAGNFLSQSLRSKTRTNHLFATVVSFSCLTLDAFVSFDVTGLSAYFLSRKQLLLFGFMTLDQRTLKEHFAHNEPVVILTPHPPPQK